VSLVTGVGLLATCERCRASFSGLIFFPARNGLDADFLLVKTAERMRRIGVGLPSSEASDGGASREPLSEGVAVGENSKHTKAESLSVADATLRRSANHQYPYYTRLETTYHETLVSSQLPDSRDPH